MDLTYLSPTLTFAQHIRFFSYWK